MCHPQNCFCYLNMTLHSQDSAEGQRALEGLYRLVYAYSNLEKAWKKESGSDCVTGGRSGGWRIGMEERSTVPCTPFCDIWNYEAWLGSWLRGQSICYTNMRTWYQKLRNPLKPTCCGLHLWLQWKCPYLKMRGRYKKTPSSWTSQPDIHSSGQKAHSQTS